MSGLLRTRAIGIVTAAAIVTASALGAADDTPTILVSRQLLAAENLKVGELVQVSSSGSGEGGRTFRIAGVYEPVANPSLLGARRQEVRLHLGDLLALTADPGDRGALDTVAAINVALDDPSDAAAFGADLSARVPGLVTRPAVGSSAPFVVLERFHLAIALVTVIASSVFLLALMVMLVDERREIVGMLRLIGFRRRRILQQVLAEGSIIALGGAVFGVAFAAAVQRAVNAFFQWKYDTVLVFVHITPHVVLQSALLAIPLGIAASLVASWTLLRRQAYALARR